MLAINLSLASCCSNAGHKARLGCIVPGRSLHIHRRKLHVYKYVMHIALILPTQCWSFWAYGVQAHHGRGLAYSCQEKLCNWEPPCSRQNCPCAPVDTGHCLSFCCVDLGKVRELFKILQLSSQSRKNVSTCQVGLAVHVHEYSMVF